MPFGRQGALRRYKMVRIGLVSTTLLAGGLSQSLLAQVAGQAPPPPVNSAIDENGVDIMRGTFVASLPTLSIGGDQGLTYVRDTNGVTNAVSTIEQIGGAYVVTIDGKSDRFTPSGGSYISTEGNGATLTISGGTYTYTSRDGIVATFASNSGYVYPFYEGELARLTSQVYPDGSRKSFALKISTYCWGGYDGNVCNSPLAYVARIASVTNSNGYQLKFTYAFNETTANKLSPDNYSEWSRVTKVTAINNAVDYCDPVATSCSFSASWPSLTFGSAGSVSDAAGQVTTYGAGISGPGNFHISTTLSGDKIGSASKNGVTTTYTYSDNGNVRTTVATNPQGNKRTYTTNLTDYVLTSFKDELNRITSYEYDSYHRVTKVAYPEGNYVRYTYDARGNVTETRQVAKAGSGLADIVTTAGYESGCSNAKTCNKPIWTRDAKGNQTDYTYNLTHGGLVTTTKPAATIGGLRPTTTIGYSPFRAYYKTSAGAIGASSSQTYKATSLSTCQTLSACAGGADEVKQVISFGAQDGTANNLLPVSVSSGSGNGALTATRTITYDNLGNLITTDGPLPGAADMTRYRYDALRRIVGVVGQDADASGPLKYRAQRISYNGDDQRTLLEKGTVNSQSDGDWSGFNSLQQIVSSYDGNTRKTSQKLTSGGTTYSVTQYSYDNLGRLDCTAVRMNGAAWGSLPASACSLQAAGTDGPDRITKTNYDAAGQVTNVAEGVGTSAAATVVTTTYGNNGQQLTLKDGENNLTTYEYDGFDRLSKVRYPNVGKGAGTSSTSDYTQNSYDVNGNVTNVRLRDGQNIGLSYDNLDRLILKDRPGNESDVSYTYDLLGRMTGASQAGNALSFGYDALGRNISQGGPLGSVQMEYDLAGNRTALIWPDGFRVTFNYNADGSMNGIYDSATITAAYAYDDLGRRAALNRVSNAPTSYGYDGASRLTSMTQNLAGSGNDLTLGYSYNPAGQLKQKTQSNDLYAWQGYVATDRSYGSNGLNQYTSAGTTGFSYDARGNLRASGSSSYSYDSENRLVSGPNAALNYDPLGRLYQVTSSSTNTRFLYAGNQLIAEYDSAGTVLRRYVHGSGADEPIIRYEQAGLDHRWFFHADERGSVVAMSDGAGGMFQINSYDEYGIPGAGNSGRFQYTGQTWIPELGMYYYKARFYSPTLGRFMQTDPIGYADGMNPYTYVGNDPVNFRDPKGLQAHETNPNYKPICPAGDVCGPTITVDGQRPTPPPSSIPSSVGGPAPSNGGSEGGGGGQPQNGQDIIVTAAAGIGHNGGPPLDDIVVTGARSSGLRWLGGIIGAIIGDIFFPDPACCFTAGTLVDTPTGLKAIETLRVGDLVVSRDPSTGATMNKPIVGITPAHERHIWMVTVSYKGKDGRWRDERYETTDDHPWRTEDGRWVTSAALKQGESLARENGTAIVVSVVDTSKINLTYNLTIADFHTYFVGQARTWVHNQCGPSVGEAQRAFRTDRNFRTYFHSWKQSSGLAGDGAGTRNSDLSGREMLEAYEDWIADGRPGR